MTKLEILETVNRIERREIDRRTAERMDAGRRLVDQRKAVQRVMAEIKASALTTPLVAGTLAIADFKAYEAREDWLTDKYGVDFADNWGDAR